MKYRRYRLLRQPTKLTESIKKFAKENGADLIGIAPVERFKNAPPMRHPEDLLPGAKSVIVAAIRYPLSGVLRIGQPPAYALPSIAYAKAMCESLEGIALNLMRYLEDKDFRALAVPVTWPTSWRVRPYEEMNSPLQGMFSHRHAAVAAGLGQFGKHTLVLTPQFGPRQRFISVITDAKLTPDPMYEGKPLCPEECNTCVNSCPLHCLNKDKQVSCEIGDKKFKYPKLDIMRCAWVEQYRLAQVDGLEFYGLKHHKDPPEEITYEKIDNAIKEAMESDRLQYSGPNGMTDTLGKCLRVCCELFEKRRKS